MDLFYFKDPKGNFGDDLNEWLWDRLLPGWREGPADTVLVGVGTLINEGMLPRDKRKLILGSGTGYGDLPFIDDPDKWDFRAVRGPRSAALLGLPENRGIIDPAVLISDDPDFADLQTAGPPIFIPHHRSLDRHPWAELCKGAGLGFVSPGGESRSVIRAIAQAPLVVTESMHGAILADAFRTPWVAVAINSMFNTYKWHDWADSLGIDLTIHSMFPQIDWLKQRLQGQDAISQRIVAPKQAMQAQETAGKARVERTGWGTPARVLLERNLARRNLRKLMAAPASLSDPDQLAMRKAQFRTVLDAVSQDYLT